MKIRSHSKNEKVELMMTPMIDIVFQLLVFFIMSFKIVAQEGDFNIKMPLGFSGPGDPMMQQQVPMKVRLIAGEDGSIANILFNDQSFGTEYESLRNRIVAFLGPDRTPGSLADTAEIELDCDYDLHYAEVINAITAVQGYVKDNNEVERLVSKLKFSPPRDPRGR
jgi:biopolymer transport protein ExbD